MERLDRSGQNNLAKRDEEDQMMNLLSNMGIDHEVSSLEDLVASETKHAVEINSKQSYDEQEQKTVEAMRDGADVIYQARLRYKEFAGYADFLVKVEGESSLGEYHYEVWDSKLARQIKTSYTIQLCAYQEMLAQHQGCRSKYSRLILGNGETTSLETESYYSYYQLLKTRFLDFHRNFRVDQRPHPFNSDEYGDWSAYANEIFKNENHLNGIAGITKSQIKKLNQHHIMNMDDLALHDGESVPGLKNEVLERLKKQATIQIKSRNLDRPLYEVIKNPEQIRLGLKALPPKSLEDVFFDIEGYPLDENGLEYLWGASYYLNNAKRAFKAFWGHDLNQEKLAFENFIDWVYEKYKRDQTMHIYHYASYEITACKKLMQRWGTREFEVDELLRNGVFIDLYTLVKNSIFLGEPRYSIKNVEHLYRPARQTDVGNGGDSVVVYQEWRTRHLKGEEGSTPQTSKILQSIMDYNIDDCDSTEELVLWLRDLQNREGITYTPPMSDGESNPPKINNELVDLREDLLSKDDDLKTLFAHCLEFHDRENKNIYWKMFERLSLLDRDLYDDDDCLVRCHRTSKKGFKAGEKDRNLSYEYHFDPNQAYRGKTPTSFYIANELNHSGWPNSVRVSYEISDLKKGTIYIKQKEDSSPKEMTLIPNEVVPPYSLPLAIFDLAKQLNRDDLNKKAIMDFLLRNPPSFEGIEAGSPLIDVKKSFMDQVTDLAISMNDSYLVIQGPPGAGKTYTAKHMIASLLKRGQKIGICSNSHKAIHNLLISTAEYCKSEGVDSRFMISKEPDRALDLGIDIISNNKLCHALENTSSSSCVGTTAFGFSRDDLKDCFDVVFIDEAGQVSVANLIAISRSCKNLIIMGDQMQLAQPTQGSHPGDSGLSILDYFMKGKSTIDAHMGIFLDKTYRCHPEITKRISEVVYDSKLFCDSSTEHQKVILGPSNKRITMEHGVLDYPLDHEGNTQCSFEEIEIIKEMIHELLDSSFRDKYGKINPIRPRDILIVAPYNHQVNELQAELGPDYRIATVDKFQGQEAPVTIISMCASNPSDAPRGIEFLLSTNRLNVAISRAQALAIVVRSKHMNQCRAQKLSEQRLIGNFFKFISPPHRIPSPLA
jgi:uncharacterized protein